MNKRLRIAIVVDFLPTTSRPHSGRVNYQRVKALSKYADLQVFCLEPDYLRPTLLRPPASVNAVEVPGARVKNLRYQAVPFLTRALNGRTCAKILTSHVREFGPDVILAYFAYPMGFAAQAVARHLGVPTIIGAVGSDLRRMNGLLVRPLIRKTIMNAECVVTVSEELRHRAIALGAAPEKCVTIYNGCDSEVFRPGDREAAREQLQIPANAELVLFVGNLLAVKGTRELLEATAMMASERPNLRVAFIGEGPLKAELRARVSKPDLAEHVRFVGGALPEEVAQWMRAANVFCLPSHSEGTPNVVIEALSCGRPVVATSVGGTPNLLNARCGILVAPRNARELANGLARALGRAWNEEDIASSFKRSWKEWAKETYEVCEQAVRQGQGGGG